jgi:hypothetical protein
MKLEDKIAKIEALSNELADRVAPTIGNDRVQFEREVYMGKFAIKIKEDAQTLETHLKELKEAYKNYTISNRFKRLLGKPDHLNVQKTSTNALVNTQRLFENLNHFIQTVYDPEAAFKAHEEVNKTGKIVKNYKISNIKKLKLLENIPFVEIDNQNINLMTYFDQKFKEGKPFNRIMNALKHRGVGLVEEEGNIYPISMYRTPKGGNIVEYIEDGMNINLDLAVKTLETIAKNVGQEDGFYERRESDEQKVEKNITQKRFKRKGLSKIKYCLGAALAYGVLVTGQLINSQIEMNSLNDTLKLRSDIIGDRLSPALEYLVDIESLMDSGQIKPEIYSQKDIDNVIIPLLNAYSKLDEEQTIDIIGRLNERPRDFGYALTMQTIEDKKYLNMDVNVASDIVINVTDENFLYEERLQLERSLQRKMLNSSEDSTGRNYIDRNIKDQIIENVIYGMVMKSHIENGGSKVSDNQIARWGDNIVKFVTSNCVDSSILELDDYMDKLCSNLSPEDPKYLKELIQNHTFFYRDVAEYASNNGKETFSRFKEGATFRDGSVKSFLHIYDTDKLDESVVKEIPIWFIDYNPLQGKLPCSFQDVPSLKTKILPSNISLTLGNENNITYSKEK